MSEFPRNGGAGARAYAGDDGEGGAGGCHFGGGGGEVSRERGEKSAGQEGEAEGKHKCTLRRENGGRGVEDI